MKFQPVNAINILMPAWAIGIGARMIAEYPSLYKPNMFDIIFDWGLLLTLGIIMISLNIWRMVRK